MIVSQLDQEIAALGLSTEGISDFIKAVAVSSEITRRLGFLVLSVAAAEGELRVLLRSLKSLRQDVEIDPDDKISTIVLNSQSRIRQSLQSLQAIAEFTATPMSLSTRVASRILSWQLRGLHRLFGDMRTHILEHDADCSPIVGSYSSAAELIRALDDAG
jgi:hypothetical protein